MTAFYSRLSYSFGNEDWDTEHEALQIQPNDRVLCITASGDRPLNLLVANCKEIVSLDTNPIQNHLLSLKKTALQELTFQEYMEFLGVKPCNNRLVLFEKVKNSLPKDTLNYWIQNEKSIKQGVLYSGAVEKRLKVVSQVFRFFRRKKIDQLFAFNNQENQKQFVQKKWDSKALRKIVDIALHPYVTKIFIKDPGLYEHLDDTFHVGKYIYQRIHSSLEKFPAKKNIILSMCFHGKVFEEGFPPYLKEQESHTIKSRLDRISFKTIDLIRFLETAKEGSFDCFSLSDVASYMDYDSFIRLLKGIIRCSKPNARFCIRQFLTHYSIPDDLKRHFERNSELEQKLEKEDRCFVYRFLVGKVVKT